MTNWLKEIVDPSVTTTTVFAGDAMNYLIQYFKAVNHASGDPTMVAKILTETRYYSGKLRLFDSDQSHTINFATPGFTEDKTISIPSTLGASDDLVTAAAVQTLTNKVYDSGTIGGTFIAQSLLFQLNSAHKLILSGDNGTSQPLDLRRANNTAASTIDFSFYHYDSNSAWKRATAITSELITPTAGAVDTYLNLWVQKGGSFVRALRIRHDGLFHFVGNVSTTEAFLLSTSGLSAARTFTFPNASGKLLTAESNANFTVTQTFGGELWVSRAAQSGVAESIAKFAVSDTTNGSTIDFANATSTNGHFAPWIILRNLDSADHPAFYFYGYIGDALDTGTQPVMRFDARKQSGSAVTTRPLFSFRSAGSEIFQINQTHFLFASKQFDNIGTISNSGLIKNSMTGTPLMTLYRQTNTVNSKITINFNAHNSSAAEVNYASIFGQVQVNTAGVQEGRMGFDVVNAGTNRTLVYTGWISGEAFLAFYKLGFGSPAVQFRTTGLTGADHIMTFPDISGEIATRNSSNAFTVWQEIQTVATAELIKLYRPESASTDIDISCYWNNSIGTKMRYVVLRSTPVVTTSGSETSRFDIWLLTNGGFVRNLRLNNIGELTVAGTSTSNAFRLSPAGLSADRLFTFPNIAGKLATDNFANVFTDTQTVNKTQQAGVGELVQEWKISDSASHMRIRNQSATDGEFIPQILSFNNGTTSNNGLRIISEVNASQADVSGNQGVMVFDSRKVGSVALTARPIYEFQNAGTSVFKIHGNGDVLQTVIAQTGVAELLGMWQVSDDTSSYLKIENATSTNAVFAPMIKVANLTSASLGALHLFARINTTHDTGSVSVFWLDARLNNDSVITTRPLFDIRNFGVSVFKINAKGDLVTTVTAQSGVAETIQEWKVSDSSGYVRMRNQGGDAAIAPEIATYNQGSTSALPSLSYLNYIASTMDTGTAPVLKWSMRNSNETAIATRPLFQLNNLSTPVFQINADGTVVSEGITLKTNVWETKPTASTYKGSLLYEEDTNSLYRSDGSAWQPILTKMETIKRTGAINGGCLTVNALGVGALAEGTLYGDTPTKGFSGNGGTTTFFNDAVNADGPTGYRVLTVSRADRYPKLRCKTSFEAPSRTRFHCGLTTQSGQITAGTTVPLLDSQGGIMFGFDETSNWKIWTCDATGPVTVTDTGIAVTATVNNPDIVTLRYDYANTTLYWTIQTFLGVYRGNGSISVAGGAKLPLVAQILHFHWNFEIINTTATDVGLFSVDYEGDK